MWSRSGVANGMVSGLPRLRVTRCGHCFLFSSRKQAIQHIAETMEYPKHLWQKHGFESRMRCQLLSLWPERSDFLARQDRMLNRRLGLNNRGRAYWFEYLYSLSRDSPPQGESNEKNLQWRERYSNETMV